MRVIWIELRKVWVNSETAYGLKDNAVMVGRYIWGTLQTHRIMEYFLRYHLQQHPEVAPYINLYLFEHRALRVEVVALKKKVEVQDNMIN